MLEMVHRLDPPLVGFAQNGLSGEDDVPQIGARLGSNAGRGLKWEREDVGGDMLAAIGAIEPAQQGVIAKHDGGLAALGDRNPGRVAKRAASPPDRRVAGSKAAPVAPLGQNGEL